MLAATCSSVRLVLYKHDLALCMVIRCVMPQSQTAPARQSMWALSHGSCHLLLQQQSLLHPSSAPRHSP